MSSSNDTNIRVRFTANTQQIKQMFSQMQRLQNKVKQISKTLTRLSNDFKKLGSKTDTTSNKIKKLNKSFTSQQQKQDKTRASMQRLTSKTKGYGNAVKRTDSAGKRGNKTLGFTGLAFGFIGGIAGFAANQIRNVFNQALEESAALLSEINRISLFSDTAFLNGAIDPAGFGKAFDLAIVSAEEFGLLLSEVPTLLKEINKASPSSINIEAFRTAVLGFKALENEVSTSALAGDLSTIIANFPESEIEDVSDLLFAFSRESKLSFTAGSKAIAFAAQSAKLLNTPLNELLSTMVTIVAAVPGERGNAGRAIRAFIGNLTELDSVIKFQASGIPILDETGKKFIGLDKILTGFGKKVQEIKKTQGDLAQVAFLEEFGLDKNALTGILSFVNATDEAKESARGVFTGIEGTQAAAVADQAKTVGAEFNRLKNSILRVKLEFTQGLAPALSELNVLFADLFADTELVQVIRDFGAAIGEGLAGIAKFAVPILKLFGGVLKSNEPLVKALATATIGLFAALSTITVVFPILGFFFALIFLHEKLIARFVLLGAKATLVTKAYGNMWKWIGALNIRFKVWLAQMRKGNLSLGIFGASLKRSNLALISFGTRLKLAAIAFKVFAVSAFRSLLVIARGWVIALLPLVIIAAAFVGLILLAKRYEDQIGGVLDKLDESGTLSENFSSGIEQLMQLLQGNPQPFFQPLINDMKKVEDLFGRVGDSWNILLSDLGQSQAFKILETIFNGIKADIDAFIDSITFEMPDVWAFFSNIVTDIIKDFSDASASVKTFFADLGIEIPDVWAELTKLWKDLKTNIDFMLKPLTDFLDTLKNFELPAPLKELQVVIEGIAKAFGDLVKTIAAHPIVAAGLELLDIFGQFGKNIGGSGNGEAPTSLFGVGEQQEEGFIGPLQPLPQAQTQIQGIALEIADVGKLFGIPEAFAKEMPEILEENQEKYEITNVFLGKNNLLLGKSNIELGILHVAHKDNIVKTILNTSLLQRLTNTMDSQMIEVIRNINIVSVLTTMVARVNLMFAQLIGQGNRAAGKLASLEVSPDGVFSIRDPGVSSSDRTNIGRAGANLTSTLGNQVDIAVPSPRTAGGQNTNITITPTITINNAQGLNEQQIVDLLNDALAQTLQKNISNIVSA